MKTYMVPLIWQMYGQVDVEAESEDQARTIALGPKTPLPGAGESDYVEGSVAVDEEIGVKVVN